MGRPRERRRAWVFVIALSLGLGACSASDPVPSPLYDGRYGGTRKSDAAEACGIVQLQGRTSARVSRGHLEMSLFGPKTPMTGTVGEDGRVRASGIWANPTGGFPGVTVLDGQVSGNRLEGTATDFRCHTDIDLLRLPDRKGTKAPGARP